MKVGDYETAEFVLENLYKNKDHDLAEALSTGTVKSEYKYSDAATAYLDGYQNYPKSKKAPDNLLKLGITMVQLGEKDQGCKMISIKKEYPKASKSVLQKAQYEQKFKCNFKSTFKNNKELLNIYLNFKKKIDKIKNKRFLLAISGGPDSLALAALARAYNLEKKAKFYFALVNHNIRTESAEEAKKTKKLLKKHKINLSILTIKEKIIKDIQNQARKKRYEILKILFEKNIKVILTAHN